MKEFDPPKPTESAGGLRVGDRSITLLKWHNVRKNGKRRGKQNHLCKNFKRQFIDVYSDLHKYPDETRKNVYKCMLMAWVLGGRKNN